MTATDPNMTALFIEFSRRKLLEQYWPRLRSCVESLTDEQIWWRPNEASNSIGNLMLHLNGNVRQWLVDSFSRQEDRRDRPAEFAAEGGLAASELLERLGATMQQASAVLGRLTEADLLDPYEIQGYHVRGLDAVYQVVEHFGLHYGQIAYITKQVRGVDLGFYTELNKTGRAG
jgi:DNA-binding transcriptional ArsR family regulator